MGLPIRPASRTPRYLRHDGQGDEDHDHVHVGRRAVRCHLVEDCQTGQKPKDVKSVFTALQGIAASEVTKGKFVIPQVVMLKLKQKPARPAGKKMMFGKEVKVAAKKASKVVKAFPAAAIKKSI